MPEVLIIELRDGTPGMSAALVGPARPPQLGPSYQAPPSTTVAGMAAQTASVPSTEAPRPETTLLGTLRPVVSDLVMGLRDTRIGLGRLGDAMLNTTSKWTQADPFFTRQRTAMIAGRAAQTFQQEGGFAGQALGGVANTIGAFAIGGPLFAGLTAFTSALRLGVEWLRHWRERVQEATETLKPFGPQLARQSAMEEVKNLRQDIERAKKMDDTLARFVAAQGELQRAQQRFDDRILKTTAERETRIMEVQAKALDTLARDSATAQERMQAVVSMAWPRMAKMADDVAGIAGHVRRLLGADREGTTEDFLKQLDEMARLPMEAGDVGPRDPDRRLRFPPLFGGGGV